MKFYYRGEWLVIADHEPTIAELLLTERAGLDVSGGDAERMFALMWLAARKRYGDVPFSRQDEQGTEIGFDQETLTSLRFLDNEEDMQEALKLAQSGMAQVEQRAAENGMTDPTPPSGRDGENPQPRAVRRSARKTSASKTGTATGKSSGRSSRSTTATPRKRSTS